MISQSPTDVQPVLRAIAKAAVRFCGAEDSLIALYEGSEIQISAHEGPIPADENRWPLDRGTAMGRAMLERQTVHLADIEMLDPADFPAARELSRREGFKASVAAPMMREDQPIGAVLLPLYILVISCFKTTQEIYDNRLGLPQSWDFGNFAEAWTRADLGQNFLNSLIVTGGAVTERAIYLATSLLEVIVP